MQLQKLLGLCSLVLLGNVVGSFADLEANEIPKQCKQICEPIVQRSDQCDRKTPSDYAELECICKLDNAPKLIPLCEACVAKYHAIVSDDNNPHDNDVYDIIQFCSFTTTSYDPAAAKSAVGSLSSATDAGTASTAASQSSATDASATSTRSGTGTGAGSESGKSGSSTTPTAATGTSTVNAAPIPVPMARTTVAFVGLLTLGWL